MKKEAANKKNPLVIEFCKRWGSIAILPELSNLECIPAAAMFPLAVLSWHWNT